MRQKPVEKGEKVVERRGWTEGKFAAAGGSTEARRKKREWLHQNGQHRRSSGIYIGRKVLTYNNLKSDTRVEQQTVELTFRQEASSGKGNERHYEIAHEFMKKKGDSEVWKIGDCEV